MAKSKTGVISTNLRYENQEVYDMVKEIAAYYVNSDNGTINFCIKEYYTKVFKKD